MGNVIDFTKKIMESKEESVERKFGVETFYKPSGEMDVNNLLFGAFISDNGVEVAINPIVMGELTKEQLQELIIKLTEALAIL